MGLLKKGQKVCSVFFKFLIIHPFIYCANRLYEKWLDCCTPLIRAALHPVKPDGNNDPSISDSIHARDGNACFNARQILSHAFQEPDLWQQNNSYKNRHHQW